MLQLSINKQTDRQKNTSKASGLACSSSPQKLPQRILDPVLLAGSTGNMQLNNSQEMTKINQR